MSKAQSKDDLRYEYDMGQLGRGVTGKYHGRAVAQANLVLLDPDVAEVFPDAASVNRVLRLLIGIAASNAPAGKRKPGRPRPAAVAGKAASTEAPARRRPTKVERARPGSSTSRK